MLQNFLYRARTGANQTITGRIQASSLEDAKKILLKNQLTPLSLTLPKTLSDYLPFIGRVSLKDRSFMTRQLSTMIGAGLTLSQALQLLVRQGKRGSLQSALVAILNDLQDGFTFSSALARFPAIFDTIFVNVVRSGEATGKLEVVLQQLATTTEKDVKLRSKLKGALFYPSFIIVAMIVVGLIMTTKVVPQLKDVFLSSGHQLPFSTTLLIAISDFLINRWFIVILGIIILAVGIRAFLKSEIGIRVMSKVLIRLPIFGQIVQQTTMARFSRLLGMLLGSGVPLLESLRLINDSFSNREYQRGLAEVVLQVERGVPMSAPIASNPVFPPIIGQMVAVGEQTGKMDEVMNHLADYYEAEVETKVAALATLIEPLVILLLGVGVAFLVIAILLPVYQISTTT